MFSIWHDFVPAIKPENVKHVVMIGAENAQLRAGPNPSNFDLRAQSHRARDALEGIILVWSIGKTGLVFAFAGSFQNLLPSHRRQLPQTIRAIF